MILSEDERKELATMRMAKADSALADASTLVEHGMIDAKTPVLLGTIATITVLRRASNFAFSKPTRETLFTVIQRDQKYASKGFIDTVVYRGSDVANAWLFRGFLALGFSLGGIVLAAAPLALRPNSMTIGKPSRTVTRA